jgi:hypothetical protein
MYNGIETRKWVCIMIKKMKPDKQAHIIECNVLR